MICCIFVSFSIVVGSAIGFVFFAHKKERPKAQADGRILVSKKDWPHQISEIHKTLESAGADTSSFEVSYIPRKENPNEMRDAMVCRVQLETRFCNKLIVKHDLRAVGEYEGSDWRGEVRHPLWWADFMKETKYYASRNYVEDKGGPHFLVAFDRDSQMAYLIFKPNEKSFAVEIDLVDKRQWPGRVKILHDIMVKISGGQISDFEVALAGVWKKGDPNFFLCRVKIDYLAWKKMKEELALQPTNSSVASTWESRLSKFTTRKDWWPRRSQNIEYQGSSNYFEGRSGYHYLTAYDNRSETAFVIYVPK